MKKIVSLLLAILCISGMLIIPAYAAAYPSISTKAYIETKAETQIDVYKNKWRTTRGTCSPAKSYYAYIDPDDTVKILAIYTNADSALVEYPTSSGNRRGYVKLDTLFYHAPKFDFKATASANTYVRPYGAKYGSIAKGDTVYHVGESNNHVLVIYTAKSGSRAYKLAYITKQDYSKMQEEISTNTMSNALYQINSTTSKLTCNFDGYVNTKGRHEGIDFAYKIGAKVYSLTDGKIIRIEMGKTGSSGLSTIAIYNEQSNKTVIYLHAAPLADLKVGTYVSKGQQIATESWRGMSSQKSAHTHVEVRDGQRKYAATSVNDSKLDNSNPYAFWISQGYKVS